MFRVQDSGLMFLRFRGAQRCVKDYWGFLFIVSGTLVDLILSDSVEGSLQSLAWVLGSDLKPFCQIVDYA